jgi:hypothetical protein
VVAPLLAVALLPQGRQRRAAPRLVALILLVDLKGDRGCVSEDDIDIGREGTLCSSDPQTRAWLLATLPKVSRLQHSARYFGKEL